MKYKLKKIEIIQQKNKLFLVKIYEDNKIVKKLIKDKYKEALCLLFTAISCNIDI